MIALLTWLWPKSSRFGLNPSRAQPCALHFFLCPDTAFCDARPLASGPHRGCCKWIKIVPSQPVRFPRRRSALSFKGYWQVEHFERHKDKGSFSLMQWKRYSQDMRTC